jgi:hypothetical protein
LKRLPENTFALHFLGQSFSVNFAYIRAVFLNQFSALGDFHSSNEGLFFKQLELILKIISRLTVLPLTHDP